MIPYSTALLKMKLYSYHLADDVVAAAAAAAAVSDRFYDKASCFDEPATEDLKS